MIQSRVKRVSPPEKCMLENLASPTFEAERAELFSVIKALARYPRLASLAQYLGEMHFSGMTKEINEYNIATEVFGRSKTIFNANEDSIVRVEAHRLRKRLKEYYEGEGKNNSIQMLLPPGSYIPVFSKTDAASPKFPIHDSPDIPSESVFSSEDLGPMQQELPKSSGGDRPKRFLSRQTVYAFTALFLLIAATVAYLSLHTGFGPKPINRSTGSNLSQLPAQPIPPSAVTVPLRLIAGYSGGPQIDSSGNAWGADRYFHGGKTWIRPESVVARTSDPLLFRQWRTGDFSYDIPAAPGIYELHLYFVASEREGDDLATFTIGINGDKVLQGFDVVTDALGENIADERVFRDVAPARDGMIHISFAAERGVPVLSAIELLPGIPRKQLPIRVLTQLTPFRDHDGNLWHPDTYFMNGKMSPQRRLVEGSPDPGLYAAERYGHFTYALPADPRDRYTVVLHFAEFYFGPTASGAGGTGDRIFRVLCNGETLLDNFDIFKEAGSLHPLTKTFYHLKPTAQGKLNLTFEPMVNYATVSGIELIDESE
jgi:hypothetical protein